MNLINNNEFKYNTPKHLKKVTKCKRFQIYRGSRLQIAKKMFCVCCDLMHYLQPKKYLILGKPICSCPPVGAVHDAIHLCIWQMFFLSKAATLHSSYFIGSCISWVFMTLSLHALNTGCSFEHQPVRLLQSSEWHLQRDIQPWISWLSLQT